jgi:antitoxin component YwqK of YwqJK toxin-antitoxin module
MRKKIYYSTFFLVFLSGCVYSPHQIDAGKIASMNIIDRNGMSETIHTKDRLNAYEKTNFLAPQPYQKVMRIYAKEKNGDIRSCITSYHPNGLIKQYLEAVNHRACGRYHEWHPNGSMKIDAMVIGGTADINTQAEQNWLFDGVNRAWDEEGLLTAEIRYAKGELQGESVYYHPNGKKWKICPFSKSQLDGKMEVFLEDGSIFQTILYKEGKKNGLSARYWSIGKIAYQEEYADNLLLEACYYDFLGHLVASIRNGKGFRALFGKKELQQLQEYDNGQQEGCVKVFDEQKNLVSKFSVKNGEKHGEEIDYFPSSNQPKLLLTWHEGVLQGPVKTWYEEGQLESQREMSGNQKQGLLTAWYRNGALMLVEEYDNDRLIKGEYYRMSEKTAVSQIERGKGIATLFNPEGNFSRKIYYEDGKPAE